MFFFGFLRFFCLFSALSSVSLFFLFFFCFIEIFGKLVFLVFPLSLVFLAMSAKLFHAGQHRFSDNLIKKIRHPDTWKTDVSSFSASSIGKHRVENVPIWEADFAFIFFWIPSKKKQKKLSILFKTVASVEFFAATWIHVNLPFTGKKLMVKPMTTSNASEVITGVKKVWNEDSKISIYEKKLERTQ